MKKLEYTPIGIVVDKSKATEYSSFYRSNNYRKYPEDSVVYKRNFDNTTFRKDLIDPKFSFKVKNILHRIINAINFL